MITRNLQYPSNGFQRQGKGVPTASNARVTSRLRGGALAARPHQNKGCMLPTPRPTASNALPSNPPHTPQALEGGLGWPPSTSDKER